MQRYMAGGFKYMLLSPLFREDSHLTNIFQRGWFNHQPEMIENPLQNGVKTVTF